MLYALDASSGRILWSYASAAEIDSPPTYYRGALLFGCRNGWAYNLRAEDGELAWRFRAAPIERQIVSYGRLESSWPVHGSLLVLPENGRAVVYAAAGRNSYLDGGIYLYGLDVATGNVLYRQQIANAAQSGEDKYAPHELEGAQPDILVFDGTHISMQSKVFDRQLKPVKQPAAPHIYATGGFLDDQAWHRNFWLFAPGWTEMNKFVNTFPNVGQLLVHENERTYGVKYFTKSQGQSRVFYPEEKGYYLFCDRDRQMFDRLPVTSLSPSRPKKKTTSRRSQKNWEASDATVWSDWIPLRVRAMVKAGKTLFVGGPPDIVHDNDPLGPFEGRWTGEVWAFDSATGATQAKYKLNAYPVFDGMIAADGKLIAALENGVIVCWKDTTR
jgi:outer membrane protein assembly factor BamB